MGESSEQTLKSNSAGGRRGRARVLGERKLDGFRSRDISGLHVAASVCQLTGVVESVLTTRAIPTWYASLKKSFFNPPSWVFAVVWVTILTLMGMWLFITGRKGLGRHEIKSTVSLFGVLALNVLSSVTSFGMQSPLYGFVVIVLLWVALLATMVMFYRISETAGILLLPYFLWGSFAVILNFSILILNP
jgi:benzodiazapine receptor